MDDLRRVLETEQLWQIKVSWSLRTSSERMECGETTLPEKTERTVENPWEH